ncbi:hypothetical protein EMCG_01897 [[Emmonsia] crescens]|uniref:Uncharacterized protein n=1 Tax=[Emmonsia] crescens TaxID=73230 RepID=A0A0G2I089_9EURO|nr:hypothetical protein EMCG_01897 [Emmonsia crescens UAMH 3008]
MLIVSTSQKDPAEIISNLQSHPDGFTHVGDDGIARSFDAKGKVIDFARLSNDQLTALAKRSSNAEDRDYLLGGWDGVDGWSVGLDQIWNPPRHLLPHPPDSEAGSMDPTAMAARGIGKSKRKPSSLKTRGPECYGHTCLTNQECQNIGCLNCVSLRKKRTYCNPIP